MWNRAKNLIRSITQNYDECHNEDNHGEAGYSLLEILVVLAIIGTLMGLVAPRLLGNVDKSKVVAAKAQARTLSMQVQNFKLDMGRFPTDSEGLQVLVASPADDTGNWMGPYLDDEVLPKDPWGFDYVYESPQLGKNGNQLRPKVKSLGADNAPGGSGPNQDIIF